MRTSCRRHVGREREGGIICVTMWMNKWEGIANPMCGECEREDINMWLIVCERMYTVQREVGKEKGDYKIKTIHWLVAHTIEVSSLKLWLWLWWSELCRIILSDSCRYWWWVGWEWTWECSIPEEEVDGMDGCVSNWECDWDWNYPPDRWKGREWVSESVEYNNTCSEYWLLRGWWW